MVGVHVRLDLEDEAGHLRLVRLHRAGRGFLRARRRREFGHRVDQVAHAEFLERAAEQHRRQMAFEEGLLVERLRQPSTASVSSSIARGALVLGQQRGDRADRRGRRRRSLCGVLAERAKRLAADVVGAGERAAAPDRPGRAARCRAPASSRSRRAGRTGSRVSRSILLMKVTIGNVAQAADLEQLARARLDALGGVDHHHRRVDRGQRAVGVLGEVLVARRVEQVEDAVGVFEGHHRGDDRDAALALDAHPVGAGLAAVGLGAHFAGELDRAAEQQELLGQRGLAGVGVRDDREGAPARDGARRGHGIFGREVGGCFSPRRGDGKRRPAHWRAADWGQRYSSRRVRQGETVRAAIASRQLSGGRRDRQARRRRNSDVDHARAMTLGPLRAEGAGHIVASDDARAIRRDGWRPASPSGMMDDGSQMVAAERTAGVRSGGSAPEFHRRRQ